jgi:hypothetical protein
MPYLDFIDLPTCQEATAKILESFPSADCVISLSRRENGSIISKTITVFQGDAPYDLNHPVFVEFVMTLMQWPDDATWALGGMIVRNEREDPQDESGVL